MKYHNMFPQLRSSVGVDPVSVVSDINIDSREIRGTSNTPGHQTHHCPSPRLSLTNERRPSISSAGVLPNLSPSTDLTGVQLEPVSYSGLLGVESNLQLSLALSGRDEREIHLLGDELELAVHLVLPPASHVAPHTCPVTEQEVELIVTGGETGGVHVGMVEADVSVHVEDGEVVVQPGETHVGVLEDPGDGVLLMSLRLGSIEACGVPLTNSDLQQICLLDVLQLVSGGEDLPGGGVVVVAEVVRDDGAGPDEVVVLVEEDAGPGELSRGGLTVLEAGDGARVGPGAALLGSVHWGLSAALGPGTVAVTVELAVSVGCQGGDTAGVPLEG